MSGNILYIECVETGKRWKSRRAVADTFGIDLATLRDCIASGRPYLGAFHFREVRVPVAENRPSYMGIGPGDIVLSIARDYEGEQLQVIDVDLLDRHLPYKCILLGKPAHSSDICFKGPDTVRKLK